MSGISRLQELLSVNPSKYFDELTLKKSEKYLLGVRITNYHVVDDAFIVANVSGTTKYLTSITVVDDELSFKCNCPKQGRCKHQAALFKYAQNKLGLKIIDKLLTNKSSDDFYKELKNCLQDRSYITPFNINNFKNQIIIYKNELNKLKQENDIEDFMKLFVRVSLAIERFSQSNNKNDSYKEVVNDYYKTAFDVVSNNIEVFDNQLSIEYSYTKAELIIRLFNILKDFSTYNSRLIDYISAKINSFSSIELYSGTKEEIIENLFLYKSSQEINNGDFSKIKEIKKRLQLIPYRELYVKYLIKINDIKELIYVYNTYDNYGYYSKTLYNLLINAFDRKETNQLCESVIYNYFMYINLEDNEIKDILDKYVSRLSKDFINNAGLNLYDNVENRKAFKFLVSYYPEYEIFHQAYKSFTSLDNRINEFCNYDESIIKKIYYIKIIELLEEGYAASPTNKKSIMKYVKKLETFKNGIYYIHDLIQYVYKNHYLFSFTELSDYLKNREL